MVVEVGQVVKDSVSRSPIGKDMTDSYSHNRTARRKQGCEAESE